MVQQRGIEGVRVLLGLLSLTQRYKAEQIEQACEVACAETAGRERDLIQGADGETKEKLNRSCR
jgi:hypothetical protein